RDAIEAARRRLPQVEVPDAIRALIARMCLEESVAGHRADLVVARAARALAALRGASAVELDDVVRALELALAHRRREPEGNRQLQNQELADRAAQQLNQIKMEQSKERAEATAGEATASEGAQAGDASEGWSTAQPRLTDPSESQ